MAIAGIVAWIVWVYAQPEREVLHVSLRVHTDATLLDDRPPECTQYEGREVTIDVAGGETLWRGKIEFYGTGKVYPSIGCNLGTNTYDLVLADAQGSRLVVAISGLGEHTYRVDRVLEDFNNIEWDDICVGDQVPCAHPYARGNYES